ncbi:MAG: hypothetical protein OXL96_08860 [Candidatus Poribacteria bacterium]|nr:hypothetical protein [Candidatus Poribacteria bacterium]
MKKILMCSIFLTIFIYPIVFATVQDTSTAIQHARSDAKVDTGTSWYVAGGVCGCFGFLYAAIATPSVPATRFIGQSPEYILIYSDEYKRTAKNERLKKTGIGWGVWAAVYLLFVALN